MATGRTREEVIERRESAIRMTKWRYPSAEIAVRLGVTQRTVVRYRALAKLPPPPEPEHGEALRYRCKCDTCREAMAKQRRMGQERRAARLRADPTVAEHGRDSTYSNYGCRCVPCTEASAERHRQSRKKTKDRLAERPTVNERHVHG